MSSGLGTYAAIPGGGSVERRESSRVRRALVMGVSDNMVDIYCCCVLVVARGQSLEECWLSPAQKLSDRSVLLDVRLVVL